MLPSHTMALVADAKLYVIPGKLTLRVIPDFPGRTPPVFPPGWLQGFSS